MPLIPFDALPDDARVWVFASDRALDDDESRRLLVAVDAFLATWRAHGAPLTSARLLRDRYFLVIGVDQRETGASGCSIDGLYRVLRDLEPALGATLLESDRVYYRDAAGTVQSATRGEVSALAAAGEISPGTRVYDTMVGTAGELRGRFERAASESWHARLAPALAG